MEAFKTFYKGFLVGHPVLYISSDFGKRNIDGEIKNHNGIDIAVPQGTVLKAPISGQIITKTVQKDGAGLYVTIKNTQHKQTVYVLLMHLHSVESNIAVGVTVKDGEKIGTTGGDTNDKPNCGHSTGAHLHLEVRVGGSKSGNAVDPKYKFLAKEQLVLKETGAVLNVSNPAMLTFPVTELRTQASYKYSVINDKVTKNATEYSKKKDNEKTVATERLAPGVWQIIKLLVDSSVSRKQTYDSSISTQQGSLLNFFRKVCQEPFVEFMGDTIGNQYYFIVRKPPFDKEGWQRMIDSYVTVLDDNDILSTDLHWNNDEIYSWYQYLPTADFVAVKETNLLIPAVFFPEYAAVWGSKPLCVESNYFSFNFSGNYNSDKKENEQNGDRIMQNTVRDFKYLIESNAYNPFTRKGTITIVGDRRIKRGMCILHTSGELFYVDSVSNSYDVTIQGVSRTTTLQVSRGIYPAYIGGKTIGDKKYSYFNIIDFGKDFDADKVTAANWKDFVSKWKVDLDNFYFFMSKQQVYWEHNKNQIFSIGEITVKPS